MFKSGAACLMFVNVIYIYIICILAGFIQRIEYERVKKKDVWTDLFFSPNNAVRIVIIGTSYKYRYICGKNLPISLYFAYLNYSN